MNKFLSVLMLEFANIIIITLHLYYTIANIVIHKYKSLQHKNLHQNSFNHCFLYNEHAEHNENAERMYSPLLTLVCMSF